MDSRLELTGRVNPVARQLDGMTATPSAVAPGPSLVSKPSPVQAASLQTFFPSVVSDDRRPLSTGNSRKRPRMG